MATNASLSATSSTEDNPSLSTNSGNSYWNWTHFAVECAIVVAITISAMILLAPINLVSVLSPEPITDQMAHLRFAELTYTTSLATPHFLYHLATIAVTSISRADWVFGGFIVNLFAQIFTVILLYLALNYTLVRTPYGSLHRWQMRLIAFIVAYALALYTPLYQIGRLLTLTTDPKMLGWIDPVTYHNPTQNVLRPLSLALFLFIANYLLCGSSGIYVSREKKSFIVGAAILVIFCGLAKPNYLLALIPAMVIWVSWGWLTRKKLDWALALFGIILPALAVLVWQFVFTYINPTQQLSGSGIIFSPFEGVFNIIGNSRLHLVLRIILSITFPVLVYFVWWDKAHRDSILNFSWLAFAFGFVYMYFLTESGNRAQHGNFFWSAYITLFLLNFASARFALLQWLNRLSLKQSVFDWRSGLLAVILLLHLVSGLNFIQMFTNQYQDTFYVKIDE